MTWEFPEEGTFDLDFGHGILKSCILMKRDDDHITVSYEMFHGVRGISQMTTESVSAIYYMDSTSSSYRFNQDRQGHPRKRSESPNADRLLEGLE